MAIQGSLLSETSLIASFMGPTWAHLGPTGPRWANVGHVNLAIWDCSLVWSCVETGLGILRVRHLQTAFIEMMWLKVHKNLHSQTWFTLVQSNGKINTYNLQWIVSKTQGDPGIVTFTIMDGMKFSSISSLLGLKLIYISKSDPCEQTATKVYRERYVFEVLNHTPSTSATKYKSVPTYFQLPNIQVMYWKHSILSIDYQEKHLKISPRFASAMFRCS